MNVSKNAFACGLMLLSGACLASADGDASAPWASVYLGAFNGNRNPQLSGQDGGRATALAMNQPVGQHLAWGIDFATCTQQYDSGLQDGFFVDVGNSMDVETWSLSGQLLYVATTPKAAFYAGGGTGFYRTTLSVDVIFFGIPGTSEESDSSFGAHVLAGVSLALKDEYWLELQYRRSFAESDFGESYGRIDVGGSFVLAGLQMRFR
ncbi:MAG: outer membrane protein [Nevskiaceae bacterium]